MTGRFTLALAAVVLVVALTGCATRPTPSEDADCRARGGMMTSPKPPSLPYCMVIEDHSNDSSL